jgi:uncharacterized membrane protein YedE/YeeE
MKNLISFISGVIFSIGLIISGLIDPQKIVGFLDFFGDWDYDLALVMASAVLFNFLTFKFILKLKKPILTNYFFLPTKETIDFPLILGSILFGIGWGMIGLSPGPAIVNLIHGNTKIIMFFFVHGPFYDYIQTNLSKIKVVILDDLHRYLYGKILFFKVRFIKQFISGDFLCQTHQYLGD